MNTEPTINGHAIYTTKGAAREYGRIGCNFYKGCPHGCTYCYLKCGAPSKYLGGTEVQLKRCFKDEEDARMTFIHETRKHLDTLRETGIFFSFTTDPLIRETWDLTAFAAVQANHYGIPVKILTKNFDFIHYRGVMDRLRSPEIIREMISIGFTLTGCDDMEPFASRSYDRIYAMRVMRELGFPTFASIEPVIDWEASQMAVKMALPYCDHYKIGLRSGVKKDYYDLDESGTAIRDLTEHITAAGRTVYLKESTRTLLRRCFVPEECDRILSLTLDMVGKPWQNEHTEQQEH